MTTTPASHSLALWQLFMRGPETMSCIRHAELTLRPGSFAFASDVQLIPILFSEIPAAATSHPIVVVSEPSVGLAAVTGIEPGRNLMIRDGAWLQGRYVPAIARLYPFAPAAVLGEADTIPLVADLAADHLSVGGEGQRLFVDGKPGPALAMQLKVAHMILQDTESTRDFARALIERGVAVDRPPEARGPLSLLPRIPGVLRLDPVALGRLPDASVIEWHRRGWSAAAVLMLHAGRHAAFLNALHHGPKTPMRRDDADFIASAIV